MAYTYNDPVIFMEYAIDVAQACAERDIASVAVTAGYQCAAPRAAMFQHMDAANIDLKAFTERFYRKLCGGRLADVQDTLLFLRHETNVWFEITTLLIPGENDGVSELEALARWVVDELGRDVPVHFTAFHPDWKMQDRPPTPAATLARARRIAIDAGVHFAYTGNVHDRAGGSTYCPSCSTLLIGRDWYELSDWNLTPEGHCTACDHAVPGVFEPQPGTWGRRRQPVKIHPDGSVPAPRAGPSRVR